MFNSYIKKVAEDNKFKNHELEQTLKKKLKKEANVSLRKKGSKLQHEFSLDQLVKLDEAKSLPEINQEIQYAD